MGSPFESYAIQGLRQDLKAGTSQAEDSHSKASAKRSTSAPSLLYNPPPFFLPQSPYAIWEMPTTTQEPTPVITPTTQKTAHPANDSWAPENGFGFYGVFLSCVHSLLGLMHIIQRQLQTLIRSHKQVSPFTHTVCKHPYIHTATIPLYLFS